MARAPIPSYFYVLVVVRHLEQYLLVQERKHNQSWYLPAGGVEPGETLEQAAVRETLEEAGVHILPQGILSFDHQWIRANDVQCARWRFMLVASPEGPLTPKSTPDRHTLGARWVTREEISSFPLRDPEVIPLVQQVHQGAPSTPITTTYNFLPSTYHILPAIDQHRDLRNRLALRERLLEAD